jgi:hypothetical protein
MFYVPITVVFQGVHVLFDADIARSAFDRTMTADPPIRSGCVCVDQRSRDRIARFPISLVIRYLPYNVV